MHPALDFEAATALCKGQRSHQEDAIVTDFARGAEVGIVVLADGMGGHAAGDVASKIVVTEVFSELLFQRGDVEAFRADVTQTLRGAAMAANACLKDHVRAYPDTHGMGATLVACVVIKNDLYWISVGDSPLFLFREGVLLQLNEDHSLAPQIDFMVKSGLMAEEVGATHPDRNTLTSVLFGDDVPKIDCPAEPAPLQAGDILIVASDGLQYLSNPQIEALLRRNRHLSSAEIVDVLLHQVSSLEDPDQDNVSFSVIKVQDAAEARAARTREEPATTMRRVG